MPQSSFGELINSETPVLIDFHAEWCGPCKAQSPILKEFKKRVGERIRIVKIDTDRNPEISQSLGVRSIPTVMIFRKGKREWTSSGVQTLDTLMRQLEDIEAS